VRTNGLSTGLRHWLLDDGSLTRRLRKICNGDFRVKLIHQGRARPMANEAQRLGIGFQQQVFSREVLLYCGPRAMVYARTVIPANTLKGRLNRLAYLGEKPLGEILFTDPHIRRGELEIARLRPDELLFEKACRTEPYAQPLAVTGIWARRSVFLYHDKRLLVSEIFLPNTEFGYAKQNFQPKF
jgi:chorismate--pyruvate lyase